MYVLYVESMLANAPGGGLSMEISDIYRVDITMTNYQEGIQGVDI
jgi:hypothetical protein